MKRVQSSEEDLKASTEEKVAFASKAFEECNAQNKVFKEDEKKYQDSLQKIVDKEANCRDELST